MTTDAASPPGTSAWEDAVCVARLLGVDPVGLGGVVVRARPGPARDGWLDVLKSCAAADSPVRRLPAHISDDRLFGGLDLAATLRAGRPVAERGLLAEVDGGLVIAQMVERMPRSLAARLGLVMDSGEVLAERDGLTLRHPARFAVVAIDEGIGDDEAAPAALADRLAFRVALDGVTMRDLAAESAPSASEPAAARSILARVRASDEVVEALATAAASLGVGSARALLFAVRAARASAALAGRMVTDDADAVLAGRLVLAPRATRLPAPPETTPEQEERRDDPSDASRDPPPPEDKPDENADTDQPAPSLDEMIVQAATARLPAGILALAATLARRRGPVAAGKAGDLRQGASRGRPAGVMRGDPRSGKRLSLVATLRAAAPWQTVRRRSGERVGPRVLVNREDFRVRRLKQRTETTAIFVVDASGSSALHRLAEVKGAVELLLADCYVRRDRVALLAFRGRTTDLLLPPTRSLARAKRCLASLPGGGGTPLATGLDAAVTLADAVRRKGQTPVVILMTDGRANVARDGSPGRTVAMADALGAARALRAASVKSVLVDTSPKPQDGARQVADAMSAMYLPLPHAGSAVLSAAVKANLPGSLRASSGS